MVVLRRRRALCSPLRHVVNRGCRGLFFSPLRLPSRLCPLAAGSSKTQTLKLLVAYKNPQAEQPLACHAGLGVTSANTTSVLTEHGYAAETLPVVDGYALQTLLRSTTRKDITHIALSAPFFDTAFLKSLCLEFPRINFTVVFHSNVGFLGVDNWSTQVLGEQLHLSTQIKNFIVSGNSGKFCRAVEAAYDTKCLLLPNMYFLHGPIERKRPLWSSGPIKIGVFGATRQLKNLPTAAWAAQSLSRRLNAQVEFWVSGGREEGKGASSVLDNIEKLFAHYEHIRLIRAPWKSWLEFRASTVRHMHLLMQPSFTESFNGVTADGIAEGVPSVVGTAIDWVPRNWVADSDDAVDIACVGIEVLKDKSAAKDGYKALVAYNKTALSHWRNFLLYN